MITARLRVFNQGTAFASATVVITAAQRFKAQGLLWGMEIDPVTVLGTRAQTFESMARRHV